MFIHVERSAVARLVSARSVQSVEFAEGAALSHLLRTREGGDLSLPNGVRAIRREEGFYLIAHEPAATRTILFDLDVADPFRELSAEDALLVFQRSLRFAVKIWENLAFSQSEYPVTAEGATKYVVFPLPISTAADWRLTLDRVHRRGEHEEEHLLVFRWARDAGAGVGEIPSQSRLNIALSRVQAAIDSVAREHVSERSDAASPIGITSLPAGEVERTGILVPFENWLPLLSRVQRQFVERPLCGPERLEGPAGTGKTLALILKAVQTLRCARSAGHDHHVLFITHSVATKKAIEAKLAVIDSADGFFGRARSSSSHSLTVTTLQEWCGLQLGQGLVETEYLDRDAAESKALQQLYVAEALDEALDRDLGTHRPFMSERFLSYLQAEERWAIAEMMQHEIAVLIKGRAQEDLELYRSLPPVQYNLPLENAADRGFVFLVYRGYTERLRATGQFDTDDIVISAMSQLDTPIWRRRRQSEGFDSVFVDEAHLFNINELSVIHYIPRDPAACQIAFAIDRSQAVGDRSVDETTIERQILKTDAEAQRTMMRSVFRSSPDILRLAYSVTSAGATLFTNFVDPLHGASSAFTAAEEVLAQPPSFLLLPNDAVLIDTALSEATRMAERYPLGRSGVAVIVFDATLLGEFKRVVRERKRAFEVLERRGDAEVINRARAAGRFILAAPEYVGGLEFDAVLLAGIDEGRVPPSVRQGEGRHFLSYAAHNLLYVAITRARYEVMVLANSTRGVSELLANARQQRLIVERED